MAKEEVKARVAKINNDQNIPEIRKEVGRYASVNGIIAAIDTYSKFYPKFNLKCVSVNTQKAKHKNNKESSLAKNSVRFNLLSVDPLQKTKDIVTGTREAGIAISRRIVIAIGTGVSLYFQPPF